ncbi:uncharacterized protein RHOBADRAFT_51635 [Rhodotorula graminis WP1]|uniref:Uncharacterized protein n=1 Tax=Rhodotorula graminis (strain WP1) TaxID=578459 RepID=A0A194SAT5_RHOGW|nr:uncharacterized protein RHOBADRAFT_51635 [Rhodotorula graminis WP1]KPV77833.1 hypothetical protein RHOBADRAFT_51635 [Rhodotorula graminis WP1]
MGSPLSPLAMLPALAFFLSPTSSTRTTPSRSSGSSFFARDNPGPPPPSASTTARRASGQHQQHQHDHQQQLELDRRPRHPQAPHPPAAALDLHLSTNCTACGEPVAVEVPRWILAAMEGAQQQRQHLLSGPAYREDRGRAAPSSSAVEWRERVVAGAVGAAQAVKASPLPGLILAFLRTLFAFLLYLDERFSIHQRVAVALGMFLEGLVEIEREVGVMRGAGEALSIGWEATVKGIIAFAKAGAADAPAQYGTSERTRNESHTPRASSPIGVRPYQDSNFPSSDSPSHLPSYETTEGDFRYYDSVSTTRIPSPVLGPSRALHRNFVSSPSLQSAYLSSLSPSASPHLAASTSPSSDAFPMTPSDALLSPFDPASQAHSGVRPRMVRQRSATGPDQVTPSHDATMQVPPPSPSSGATRGGWAGKAVLGLAERMKVL